MKLYCTPGGTWAGTEAAWKAAVKAEGLDPKALDRKQIEVPTSKPELLEFLTFHGVNPVGGAAPTALAPPASTVPAIQAQVEGTFVPDLDALFVAAPIPRQVELAVALLDRLEQKAR